MGAVTKNLETKKEENLDYVYVNRANKIPHKKFEIWVKWLHTGEIEVELGRGITKYIFVFEKVNKTEYSFQYAFQFPTRHLHIDPQGAKYLPIFNTYEEQAEDLAPEYFMYDEIYELVLDIMRRFVKVQNH